MGVMLVAVAVLSTVSVAGFGIIEYQKAQAPAGVNADLGAVVDGANLTLHHLGGEPVEASKTDVVTRGAAVQQFLGDDATEVSGDGDDLFEPGERWRWTASEAFTGNVRVLLVEQQTGAIVDTAALREPTEPGTTPPTTTTEPDGAPSAEFDVSDTEPSSGQQVDFDADPSTDPDGSITAYDWDLDGDGTWDATGQTQNHSYESAGTVEVTLRVTDDDGNTATQTKQLEVSTQSPTVSIESSCEGLECSFTANASDPDGSIEAIEWSFGDGESGSGPAVTHMYATAGSYDVTATVTDDDGATATATTTVEPTGSMVFISGTAVAPGGNGKQTGIQVTLRNRRAVDVTVVATAVTVSKDNVQAIYESNRGDGPLDREVHWAASTTGYADGGADTAFETGVRIDLTENAVVASGTETVLTVSEFGEIKERCWRRWCWQEFKARNVPGATVTVEVWFDDGTHRTYTFKA